MKRRSRSAKDEETIICASCLAPVGRSEAFCPECGAPVGPSATLDPLGAVQAQGFMYRKALEGRPKVRTLVCVWMLFLPTLVGGVLGAIRAGLGADRLPVFDRFIFFWFMCGLSIISLLILFRITKNFVTIPKKKWDDE